VQRRQVEPEITANVQNIAQEFVSASDLQCNKDLLTYLLTYLHVGAYTL